MIDTLEADPPLYSYADLDVGEHYDGRIPFVDLLCAGPRVMPMLEQAFTEAEGDRQLLMAVGLSMLGSQAGVPLLVSTIQQQLQAERLPERDSENPSCGMASRPGGCVRRGASDLCAWFGTNASHLAHLAAGCRFIGLGHGRRTYG